MFDTNRVERLLSNAVRTLPHEVLCLIASRHLRIWEAGTHGTLRPHILFMSYSALVPSRIGLFHCLSFKYHHNPRIELEEQEPHFVKNILDGLRPVSRETRV